MIRSILSLRPKTGGSRALVRFFKERRIVERALDFPGCLSVEVQTLLPNGDEVLVTALWESLASYQTYLDSAGREEDVVHLQRLLLDAADAVGSAKLYENETCVQPSD